MNKSYQVVEPKILEKWLGTALHKDIILSLLYWLVYNLRIDSDENFVNVDFEVIKVTYVDSYAAIGISYINDEQDDVEKVVINKIEEYINNAKLHDFLEFSFKHNQNWSDFFREGTQ